MAGSARGGGQRAAPGAGGSGHCGLRAGGCRLPALAALPAPHHPLSSDESGVQPLSPSCFPGGEGWGQRLLHARFSLCAPTGTRQTGQSRAWGAALRLFLQSGDKSRKQQGPWSVTSPLGDSAGLTVWPPGPRSACPRPPGASGKGPPAPRVLWRGWGGVPPASQSRGMDRHGLSPAGDEASAASTRKSRSVVGDRP